MDYHKFVYEPLRIRAWLRTAVVSDEWLPLDGILLYQAHRDLGGRQDITIPGEYSARGAAYLPVKKQHWGKGHFYYRASFAQWGPHADGRDYWNKRFDQGLADLIDFRGRRGRVIVEQSTYKAYHMPIYYRSALWVEWYILADRPALEYLLVPVTHIGKKTSQGWGRVARWEFEPVPEDWSVWRDGALMRGVPVEELAETGQEMPAGSTVAHYGVRPSYWKASNQMLLVMPKRD
jgi:CRISPR type IV-associated protein Csf3